MTMNYRLIWLPVALLLLATSVSAQRGKRNKKSAANPALIGTMATPSANAKALLKQYRFAAATELLEAEQETANLHQQLTDSLDQWMAYAERGEAMMQSVEKVTFIDSVVVNLGDLLGAIRLSPSCGKLQPYGEVFPVEQVSNAQKQSIVYTNELGDQRLFGMANKRGVQTLHQRLKLGSRWAEATEVEGLGDAKAMAFPYLLSDGTTLYYAAQTDEGLGGWDIYVTRYNAETKQYLKPEHLGMPFNSPANDYLYVIDESTGLGWFATDRFQPKGKVCIYVFLPNESRVNHQPESMSEEKFCNLAMLRSIRATQTNAGAVADGRKRLEAVRAEGTAKALGNDFVFHVASGVTYTNAGDFKDPQAAKLAVEWYNACQRRDKLTAELSGSRKLWAKSPSPALKTSILTQESQLEQLDTVIQTFETQIRQAEGQKLNRK